MRELGLIILPLWFHSNVGAESIDIKAGYSLAQELLQ